MNLLKNKYSWVITTLILGLGYIVSCTKNDQVLDVAPATNSSTLISKKVTTGPTIDGTIDPMWDNATKINVVPQVPDPGNGLFAGYVGETYPATLRSMYDGTNIYFLVEWADAGKTVAVSTWYFNPAANVTGKTGWAQEPSSKSFDTNGNLIRDNLGEDKLAMLWNIDNSTPKFLTQTCYASCHVFTPYLDYSVTPAVMKSNANSGNHYTNGANEKIDMWWAHLSKDLVNNQMDDNYQDWAGGPGVTNLTGGSGNGRHVDGIVVSGASATWPFAPTYTTTPAQGSFNNRQSLKLDGTGASVTVPMWYIPGATNYYYIKASDTLAGGTARKITGVSSSGVLTASDAITIDPTVGSDYLQIAGISGGDGPKAIPSYIASPLINERADITCYAVYTGTGWVVEYKRKLKTSDVLKQDVDFSSLQDQPFGIAIWNKSNNQHAIKPNLLLKFEK